MACPRPGSIVGLVTFFETPIGQWWAAIESTALRLDVGLAPSCAQLARDVAFVLRNRGFAASAQYTQDWSTVYAPVWDVEPLTYGNLTDAPIDMSSEGGGRVYERALTVAT